MIYFNIHLFIYDDIIKQLNQLKFWKPFTFNPAINPGNICISLTQVQQVQCELTIQFLASGKFRI